MSAFSFKFKIHNLVGWIIAVLGTTVYLLTLEPTVSFWDCGEFIATSYGLQIGHPPGAPLYQLLAHCFMLLAGGDATRLAWWSNALSAVAGGFTAMFLFWTLWRIILMLSDTQAAWKQYLAAAIGAACYMFCDTVWFSAVESEVYSLSMLFSSAIVWAAVCWWQCEDGGEESRWMLLTALLLGLSVGVHQLSLLTLPMLVLVYFLKRRKLDFCRILRRMWLWLFFFGIGLTPFIILPIRAAADTPINQGNPSSFEAFRSYINRDQYEKAPLIYGRCFNSPIVAYKDGKPLYAKEMDMFFPRMWKQHSNAELYYTDWCGRHGKMVDVGGREYYKPSFGDNLVIFGGYQLGYMYLRYLMWNFSGRYDDRQGFGNLQKGQFVTGIPFVDRLYVGTAAKRPSSLENAGYNRYYMLPLLLGIIGLIAVGRRNKKIFWMLMTLFLTSSLLLAVYLNHPVYEPRERDYAYVLSFYSFAIWIGLGAYAVFCKSFKRRWIQRYAKPMLMLLAVGTPLLMASQNWDDHDRSGRYIARDSAANLLNSCDEDAILFTVGDNDTFPLWYLQYVENKRTDIQVINISLLGSDDYCESTKMQLAWRGRDLLEGDGWRQMGPYGRMMAIIGNNGGERPVYFSHYASNDRRVAFENRLQLSGFAYRLCDTVSADSVDRRTSHRLMTSVLKWQPLEEVYIDETSCAFLRQYWNDAIVVAENLAAKGEPRKGVEVLDATCRQIPPRLLKNPQMLYLLAQAYSHCGDSRQAGILMSQTRRMLAEQLEYYYTMSPSMRKYIPYTLSPLLALQDSIYAGSTSALPLTR
ncbi:MAG: DUF2723 domain-containing protein [Bacteroidales bacterium]|nr:DUF2723 domain-containing protein [Bacteroidales bacterium]